MPNLTFKNNHNNLLATKATIQINFKLHSTTLKTNKYNTNNLIKTNNTNIQK
jgi:hypothetical protein